jgi:hypothetical protein
MFVTILSTRFFYKHHMFVCTTYCGHHQVHTAFTIALLSAIPAYTGQWLHVGSVLCRYIVNALILKSEFLKILTF